MAIKELHNEIKEDEQLGISDPLNTSQDATLAQTEMPSGSFSNISSGEEIIQNGQIRSGNFAAGTTGWQIKADGDVEFNSGTFRSQLIAGSIDIPDTTTANSFHVNSDGDAWWGATTLATGVAWVKKDGSAKFTSGTIGGWTIAATTLVGGNITLDQANDKITVGAASGIIINGADSTITSNDGVTWKLNGDGDITGVIDFAPNTQPYLATYHTYEFPLYAPSNSTLANMTMANIGTSVSSTGWFKASFTSATTNTFAGASVGIAGFNGTAETLEFDHGKKFKVKTYVKMAATGANQYSGWGTMGSPSEVVTAFNTTTAAGCRFINDQGTLYAVTCDDIDDTSTDVSVGITTTNWNLYEIVYNSTTEVLFYINGVLKATHTTNVPSLNEAVNLTYGTKTQGGVLAMTFGGIIITTER